SDAVYDAPIKSIDVTVELPENLNHYVEEIDFLVDENKFGIWRIFDSVPPPSNVPPGTTITKNFDGQIPIIPLSDAETRLFEPIPKRSSLQAFVKNRSIINNYLNGHDDSEFDYNFF